MTTPPHFARHNNHSSTAPSSTHTTPMLAPASVSDSSQNAVLLSMQSPTRVIPQPISLPPLSSLTLPSGMTTPSRGSIAAQFAVSPPDRSSLAGDSVAVSPSGLSRVGIMEEVHSGRPFSMLPSSIMTVSPMLPALHDERGVSSSTSQQQQPLSLVASPPAKQRPAVAEGRPSRNSSLHLAQPLLGNTSNLSGSFDSVSAVQETDANANSNRSIRSTTGDAPRASRPRGLSRSGRSNLSDTSSSLIAMRPTVGTAAQSSAARRQHHLALSPTMQEPQQGSRSASCCGEEGTEGGAGGVPSSAFRNPHPLRDDLDMDHLEIQHEIATLLEDLGGAGHPHQDSPLIQTPHPPEPQQGDSELQSSRPGFVTLERLACATGRVPLGSNESNRLVESILQSSPASSFEADSDSSFVQGRGPTIMDPMVVRLVAIVAAQHRLLQRTMHLRHSPHDTTSSSIGAVGEATTTTVMQSLRSAGALPRPTVSDFALPPYYYHQPHDSQFFSPTNSSSGGTTATTAATTKRTSSGLTKEHSAATTASHHHLTASNADCTTGLGSVEEQALLGDTDEGKTTLHKGSFTAIPHSKQRGGLHSPDEQDDSNESASFHRRESLQRETTFLESVAGMNSEELPPPVPQDEDTASMADDGGTEVQDGEDRPERYSQLFAVLEPDTAHPRRGTVQTDASGAVPLKRTSAGATSPDDHHSVSSRAGPSRNFPVGSFASGGGEDFRNVSASGVGIGWGSINSASHVTSSAHTAHNRSLECNEGDDYVDDRSSSSGGVRTSHHTAAVNSLADLPSVSRQTIPPSHESTPLDLGSNHSTHPTPPPMFSPPADPQLQAPNPTVDMLHQSGMSNTVNHSHSASLLRYAPEGELLSNSSRTDGMNVIGSGSNLSSSKNEAREDVPSSLLELHPPPPPTPPSAPTAGQLLDGDGNPTFEHSSSSVQSSIIPPSLLPLGAGLVRKSAKQSQPTMDLATTPPPSTSQHTVMMHSGSGGMMMAPNASNSLSGGPPPSLHTALSLSGEAMGLRATFSSLRQVTISPQLMVAGGNKAGSGALPSTARRLSSRYTQPLGDFVHQQQQQLHHTAAGLSVESQPLIGFATASQNSSYQGVVDLALGGGGGGGPPDGLGSTIAPAGGLLPVTAPYADTCEASVSSIGSLRVNRRLIMKQADVQTDETGAMTLNDYLVMDCIGQGSYGQVFRALCVEPELPEGALGIYPTFEGAQKFVAIKSLQQEKLMRRRTVMEGGGDMSPFLRGLQQREAMPASPLAVGMVLDSSTARGAAAAARRMTTTLLSTVASAYQMLPSRTTTPQARQQHAHHHTSSNFNPYVRSLTSNEHGDQAVVMASSVKMPNSAAMELPPDPTASKQAHQQAVLDFIEFLDTKIIKEIAIMKQLRNKHIVQLYEAILDPVARKVYLVMQYVGGGCILDRVTFSAGVVPAASPFGSASRRGAPHPFDSSVSPSTDTETPESTSGGLFGLGNVPSLKREEKESQRLWKEAASRGEVVYKPLSRERILRYVRQIVAGLHYLHHKGILHRDIKPENILLDETGQHCYLADFGVSEIVSEGEVGDVGRVLIGTPYYIAPEVFEHVEGARLTPAVDVWALGVTVFAMATGRLPFYGTKQEDIKKKILYSEPEYPPETQLDVGLAELIKCMLKKNPRERITITMLRFGVRNNSTTVTAQSNIPHLQLPSRVTSRQPSAGPLMLSPEEEDMAGGIVTIDISPTTSPSNDARLQNVGPSPFSRPGTQYDGEGGPEGSTTAAPLPPPGHHYPNPPMLADAMSGVGFFEPTPLLGPSAAPDGPLCAIVEEMLQFGSFASPEWRGDTQTMEDLTGQYAAALVNGNLPERAGNNEWLSSPTQNPRAAHTAVVGAANCQPPAFLIATAGPQHQQQQSHPPPLAQARHGSSSSPNSTPNRGFSPVPHHHANPDHWLLPSPTAGEPLLLPTSAVHRRRSTSSTATVLSDVGGAAGNAVATAGGGTAPMGSGGMRMSIPTFPFSATAAAPWSTASHAAAGATGTTTLLPPPIPDLFDDDQCSTTTNTVSLVGGPTVGGNHHTAASGGGGSNVVHHGGGSLTVPQQRSLVRVRTSSSLATRGDSMTERVTEEQLNAAFRILLPH